MADNVLVDKDLGYSEMLEIVQAFKPITAAAGFPRGTPNSVIEKAAKNHFGTEPEGNIPARPFMTAAWDRSVEKYADALMRGLDEAIEARSQRKVRQTFELAADVAAVDIFNSIMDWKNPANAPLTVALKGFDDPLFETGEMAKAVTSTLEEGKDPFKDINSPRQVAKIVQRSAGKSRRKRKFKIGTRLRGAGGLARLAKSPGYSGGGIRKSPERRRGRAARGVVSRGVRRRGL